MISESVVGETSLCGDVEALSLSQRLVRSVSQKLKKNNNRNEGNNEEDARGVSLRCLTLYSRGGGCKVSADTSEDFSDSSARRRSNSSEEGICGTKETSIDCFSYGVKEKFWRRNNKKLLQYQEPPQNNRMQVFLPDDILEMCLVRLPLTNLMTARLVCRKWRKLTTAPRFLQMRREGFYQSPWMFVFGVVKDGYCSGEIHALDISLNQWHRLNADVLKGRFLFSVASVRDDIYVVGGCSSLTNHGKVDRSSFKTHKGVVVYSPLTKSFRKAAPMKYARWSPVLGTCEIGSDSMIIRSHQNRQERRFPRSRIGGVSDVYGDPHRLSVRRQCRNNGVDENGVDAKPHKSVKQKNGNRFVIIAVGGHGAWDEPLDSGEIYDSATNKWVEIQRLPLDFGVVCSGVVCNSIFYVYSETDKLVGYDIERGCWVRIQTSPSPSRVHEYYPKLISTNGRLFMVSVSWCEGDGQIGRRNKAVRKLWELDLTSLAWSEVSTHPDAPMDWNAAFVADRNMIFGVEMFKIFGQVLDFLTLCDVSEPGMKWTHISRSRISQELDASSCTTKSMAVLHL